MYRDDETEKEAVEMSVSANENIKPKKMRVDSTLKKTASRVAAVQALYQISQNPPTDGIDEIISDRAIRTYEISAGTASHQNQEVPPNPKMLRKIVEGALLSHGDIEELLKPGILIQFGGSERLGPLLSAILRAAVYELAIGKTAPFKVIIDEYTNIAAAFFDDNEAQLITAVLDKVAKKISLSL